MLRKKKEETPIVLSKQELMPSVLGVMNEKSRSGLSVLFFFIFLIGFALLLPVISDYVSGEQKIVFTPPSKNEESPDAPTPSEDVTFYEYSSDLKIQYDGMMISDFVINRKDFYLTILNQSEAKDYLVEHPLYLEFYDESQMLLQRIKIPNENISRNDSNTYEFELTVPTKDIHYVVIDEKNPSDYPAVNLKKESDGDYSLFCSKGFDEITYTFGSDYKLYHITHLYNFESANGNYSEEIFNYRQLVSRYSAIDGVTANITEAGNGFTFNVSLDLNEVDLSNSTIRNTLDEEVYYGKDTEARVVHFELSAMGYTCS